MLTMKAVSKDGKPVPMNPQECLPKAVILAFSKNESEDYLYWAKEETLNTSEFNVQETDEKGVWVAQASGTVMVGKTRKRDDKFFEPKQWSFKVTYSNARDSFGLPTITVKERAVEEVKNVDIGAITDVGNSSPRSRRR